MTPDDERDFEAYLHARGQALLRLAYWLVGDWDRADDVCQAAFIRLHGAWLRAATGDTDAYARRVVTNEANRWWRRPARREELVQAGDEGASDRLAAVEARDELWRLLMQLPKRQRAVVVLRYVEDQSEQETARLLGCSVGTVKSSASKALARLRLAAAPVPGGMR